MRREMVRGFTGKTVTYRGVAVQEFISGWSYPANGNVHNPTPQKAWVIDGEFFSHLRKAKVAIDQDAIAAK